MILVHFLETTTYLPGEVGREYFRKHLIWNLLELPLNTDLHHLSEHFFSSDNKVHCQVKKIYLECLKRRKWKDRWPFTWESTMTALKCLIAITKWSFHGKKKSYWAAQARAEHWKPTELPQHLEFSSHGMIQNIQRIKCKFRNIYYI